MANYHVSKHPDGGWQAKKEGVNRAAGIFDTQRKAEKRRKNFPLIPAAVK